MRRHSPWLGQLVSGADSQSLDTLTRMKSILLIVIMCAASLLAACSERAPVNEAQVRQPDTGRWYKESQVQQGARVFAANCAVCHGDRAQAQDTWRQRLADGKYPPPPLNGTAHAWHHPLFQLRDIIRNGSDPAEGNMPAWGHVLSDEDIDASIAWFQSLWPHEVYEAWREIDERRQDEQLHR